MNKKNLKKTLFRWLPLIVIVLFLFLSMYLRLDRYLSYSHLQSSYQSMISWTESHYLTSVLLFMGCYILAVTLSFPGAVFITLAGGLLFGLVLGTLYVVISATLGATLVFYAVKSSLGHWMAQQTKSWTKKMQDGFNENAFSYLMILRLIPLFPFWVVNIVPALLNVDARTYIIATFLGIIPGSFVYISIGNGLSHLLEMNQQPDLSIIFSWPILLPLIGLALLSLLPLIYKKLKKSSPSN